MVLLGELALFAGVGLLGFGYFWKRREAHLARGVGWVLFGLFWFSQAPHYIATGDAINAIATGGSIFALSFVAYHEWLSYKWNEEYEPLRFFAGAAFLCSVIYFFVERIPLVSGGLIKVVADQTAWLMNLGGAQYSAGPIDYAGNELWFRTNLNDVRVPIMPANVDIVLACTGIQALAVMLGVVACTRADRMKKFKSVALLFPVIYGVNLLRNVAVIYTYHALGWDFDFVHNVIGKSISLFTLFFLIIAIFILLPELYENINGVFELPWRKAPGHDHKKHIGRVLGKYFGRGGGGPDSKEP